MQRLIAHRRENEKGFTLIELMVVVMILAILVMLGIPYFMAARKRAADTSARSLLTDGRKAVHVIAADGKNLTAMTVAELNSTEPTVHFVDASTAPEARTKQVSVATGTLGADTFMVLATRTTNGDCVAVREFENNAAGFQRAPSTATCPASAFDPSVGWSPSWPAL